MVANLYSYASHPVSSLNQHDVNLLYHIFRKVGEDDDVRVDASHLHKMPRPRIKAGRAGERSEMDNLAVASLFSRVARHHTHLSSNYLTKYLM